MLLWVFLNLCQTLPETASPHSDTAASSVHRLDSSTLARALVSVQDTDIRMPKKYLTAPLVPRLFGPEYDDNSASGSEMCHFPSSTAEEVVMHSLKHHVSTQDIPTWNDVVFPWSRYLPLPIGLPTPNVLAWFCSRLSPWWVWRSLVKDQIGLLMHPPTVPALWLLSFWSR